MKGMVGPFTGKKHTPKAKEKMSLKLLGRISPRKGVKLSKRTIAKIKVSLKGRKAWNEGIKGIHFSPRTEFKKGMIAPNKGKKPSRKWRQHISEARCNSDKCKGPNLYNWLGGKSFEPYPIEFTQELKRQIKERDGYICQLCKVFGKRFKRGGSVLSVHHIDYNKENCKKDNLITLCRRCNCKVNFNRKYWEKYFKRILSRQCKVTKIGRKYLPRRHHNHDHPNPRGHRDQS